MIRFLYVVLFQPVRNYTFSLVRKTRSFTHFLLYEIVLSPGSSFALISNLFLNRFDNTFLKIIKINVHVLKYGLYLTNINRNVCSIRSTLITSVTVATQLSRPDFALFAICPVALLPYPLITLRNVQNK